MASSPSSDTSTENEGVSPVANRLPPGIDQDVLATWPKLTEVDEVHFDCPFPVQCLWCGFHIAQGEKLAGFKGFADAYTFQSRFYPDALYRLPIYIVCIQCLGCRTNMYMKSHPRSPAYWSGGPNAYKIAEDYGPVRTGYEIPTPPDYQPWPISAGVGTGHWVRHPRVEELISQDESAKNKDKDKDRSKSKRRGPKSYPSVWTGDRWVKRRPKGTNESRSLSRKISAFRARAAAPTSPSKLSFELVLS